MPANYLAVTIGPLYNTLLLARKTRELWSVSFTFSMLMKCITETVMPYGDLLSPGLNVTLPLHGAGIYPDRCFIQLKGDLLENFQIEEIKKQVVKAFAMESGIAENDAADYFQLYFVQAQIDENPIKRLNEMLDVAELYKKYNAVPKLKWDNYWNNENKTRSKHFFQALYNKGYAIDDRLLPTIVVKKKNNEEIRRFMSVPEISTNELAWNDPALYWKTLGKQSIEPKIKDNKIYFENIEKEDWEDDEIILALKDAFKEKFLFRHKYFSIVHADGDNAGSLIGSMKDPDQIRALSEAFNSYATKAAETLKDYGAFPVYIGGDDLLFFAPIANNTLGEGFFHGKSKAHGSLFGANLFFLLSKLNQQFKESLQSFSEKVSLSFGVMAGYYKQPMSEVLSASYNLLKHDAKEQPGKNYVSMKVQKHSGQTFQFGFQQQGELYECFLKLTMEAKDKTDNFLNSVMYKLDDQKKILQRIGTDTRRLAYFFKENFNEAVHNNYKNFFSTLEILISEVFRQNPIHKEDNKTEEKEKLDEKMEKIYGALRFVHFLNAKDINE